jgi:hypothetical protein
MSFAGHPNNVIAVKYNIPLLLLNSKSSVANTDNTALE